MVHRDVFDAVTSTRQPDESGYVLVFTALVMTIMLIMTARVVDLGNARDHRRQAQAAADAAALAGAASLQGTVNWTQVVATVKSYLENNLGVATNAWTNCSDSGASSYFEGSAVFPDAINGDTCISADSANQPTRLRVHVPTRQLPATFAKAAGVSSLAISATATAKVTGGTGGRCGICVLSPTDSPALSVTAGGALTVENADVIVNSTGATPASHSGGGAFTVSGGALGGPAANHFQGGYNPAPSTMPAVSDPLAELATCPGASACPATPAAPYPDVNVPANGSINPGVYHNISFSAGSGPGTLNPGTYIITGLLRDSSSQPFIARGVTLYFACATYPNTSAPCAAGSTGGTYALTASGPIILTPPTTGTFAGLSIFVDHNDAHAACNGAGTPQITAGGSSLIQGTIYQPSACLLLTGGGNVNGLGSAIIVWTFSDTAGGALTVDPSSGLNALKPGGVALIQ